MFLYTDSEGKILEEENKEEKGVEEEEASPNRANAQGRGVGRSRVFGAWVVSHPVRVTV